MEIVYGIPCIPSNRGSYMELDEAVFHILDLESQFPSVSTPYTTKAMIPLWYVMDIDDKELATKVLYNSVVHLAKMDKTRFIAFLSKNVKVPKIDTSIMKVSKTETVKNKTIVYTHTDNEDTDTIYITPVYKFPLISLAQYCKTNTGHLYALLNRYLGRKVSMLGQTYYNYTFKISPGYGTCAMTITPLNIKDKKTPAVKAIEAYFEALSNLDDDFELDPVLESIEPSYINKMTKHYLKYGDRIKEVVRYMAGNIDSFHITYESSDVDLYRDIVKMFV